MKIQYPYSGIKYLCFYEQNNENHVYLAKSLKSVQSFIDKMTLIIPTIVHQISKIDIVAPHQSYFEQESEKLNQIHYDCFVSTIRDMAKTYAVSLPNWFKPCPYDVEEHYDCEPKCINGAILTISSLEFYNKYIDKFNILNDYKQDILATPTITTLPQANECEVLYKLCDTERYNRLSIGLLDINEFFWFEQRVIFCFRLLNEYSVEIYKNIKIETGKLAHSSKEEKELEQEYEWNERELKTKNNLIRLFENEIK